MVAPFDLGSLNPQQLEAVLHEQGPLMIFAGAGSGKTRVITTRIARLIDSGVPPWRILAVTFTNKAAREMRDRVEGYVGGQAKSLFMGTFHSISARMLRMEGHHIGIDSNFVIFDDGDQMAQMREILKAQNIDDKVIQPRAALHEISRAKEKLLTPEKYAESASNYIERIVQNLYPAYQKALRRANAMDFDDILVNGYRLLAESTEVREKYQEKFLHVMIDEYQDVNFVQYQWAQLIAGKHRNIVIVGDDDQSIYAWRGADVSLMLRFSSDYSDAKVVTLGQNYRCTKRILAAATDVIQHNRGRASKELFTDNPEGDAITITEAGTEQEEAMTVADTILKEVKIGRRNLSDFGVLYRTNAQSRVMEEAFITMRIPHILVGGQRFYERKEIKDMLAYLRVVLNPFDGVSLKRVYNNPPRGLGATSAQAFDDWSGARDQLWWDAMRDQSVQGQLQKRALFGLKSFLGVIEEAQDMLFQNEPVTRILQHILNRSGYVEELKKDRTDESIARLENLQELINVTTQYDQTAEEPSLAGFLEQVALIADVDSLNEGGEVVTLMTLHSSKGLEFPVVFLVGMEEGIFPHSRSANDETELEEERRLAYVGITRAQHQLHLLHARRRSLYGSPNFNRRSRFLDDIISSETESLIPQELQPSPGLREVRPMRTGGYQVVEAPTPQKKPEWTPPFSIGQRVRHAKFGEGVIIACSPLKADAEVTVAFPGVTGVKKLVQSLAKLEAV